MSYPVNSKLIKCKHCGAIKTSYVQKRIEELEAELQARKEKYWKVVNERHAAITRVKELEEKYGLDL